MVWTMASQPLVVASPSCLGGEKCHVLGNGSQQGFRCETTKSLQRPPIGGRRPSFSALAIQESMGPGTLPSATIRTDVRRERITTTL